MSCDPELGPLSINYSLLPFTLDYFRGSHSHLRKSHAGSVWSSFLHPWNHVSWMDLYIMYYASSFFSFISLTSNQRIKTEIWPIGFTVGKVPQNIVLLVSSVIKVKPFQMVLAVPRTLSIFLVLLWSNLVPSQYWKHVLTLDICVHFHVDRIVSSTWLSQRDISTPHYFFL